MEAQQRLLCETETRLGEHGIHKTSILCLLNALNLSVICGISGSILYAFLFRSKKGGFGISENEKHKKTLKFLLQFPHQEKLSLAGLVYPDKPDSSPDPVCERIR